MFMLTKGIIGLGLAFVIGAICKWFDLPPPAPPTFLGSFLVLSMTVGFLFLIWVNHGFNGIFNGMF